MFLMAKNNILNSLCKVENVFDPMSESDSSSTCTKFNFSNTSTSFVKDAKIDVISQRSLVNCQVVLVLIFLDNFDVATSISIDP